MNVCPGQILDRAAIASTSQCRLVEVRPQLLVAEWPSNAKRLHFSSMLNHEYNGEYLVVNLSGQSYGCAEFQGPVMDVVMSGCMPPVDVLLRLCMSAHKWLNRSPQRWLVVHGEEVETKFAGSAVAVLAAYLCLKGDVPNPTEGAQVVCEALGISTRSLFPSHWRYLGYFELLKQGTVQTVDASRQQLARVVMVAVGGDQVPRMLQIWEQDRLVFNRHFEDSGSTDSIFQVGVHCQGDLCIRVLRGSKKYSNVMLTDLELQVCLHTAFLSDGFARFSQGDIDAPHGASTKGRTIDIILHPLTADTPSDSLPEIAAAALAIEATITAGAQDCAPEGNEPTASTALAAACDDKRAWRAGRASPMNTVFLPDDIDSFFDDM